MVAGLSIFGCGTIVKRLTGKSLKAIISLTAPVSSSTAVPRGSDLLLGCCMDVRTGTVP
jgi:hypothetical protein